MDALKRAEQAKQQGQADALPELALEPVAAPPAEPVPPAAKVSPAGLPELPKLEDLDDEFLAHARQAQANPLRQGNPADPPSAAATDRQSAAPPAASGGAGAASGPARSTTGAAALAERKAIQNAFAVKRPPAKNWFALSIGGASLLAIAAIGTYFWLQLKPAPSLMVRGVGGTPAPAQQVPPPPTPPSTPAANAAQPVVAVDTAPPADKTPPADPAPPPPTGARLRAEAPGSPPVANLPIRVTSRPAKVDPVALAGYEAFQAGNLAVAKQDYQRLLQTDPWNRDALHGLAAIAQREGRGSDAEALYARLLEADPRDALAQGALFGLRAQRGQGDPVAAESRIKSLLATQPDSAALQFALGNVYARQNRWSEAQQAYFQALTGDADNPDYLFNLAVSLDQLHQAKLAGQYYGRALTAADARPAAFDRDQAANRLRELQP
jgi:tetratricopeptide (TPR) repeat protein